MNQHTVPRQAARYLLVEDIMVSEINQTKTNTLSLPHQGMWNLWIWTAGWAMPFYIRDLSIHRFWYLQEYWSQSLADSKGRLYSTISLICGLKKRAHRHREQIEGCRRQGVGKKGEGGQKVKTSCYKIVMIEDTAG